MKSAAARQASKPAAAKRTRRASKSKPAVLVRPELVARALAAGVNITEVIEQAVSAAIATAETGADRAPLLPENQTETETKPDPLPWTPSIPLLS